MLAQQGISQPTSDVAGPYWRAVSWLLAAEIIVLPLVVWAGSFSLGLVSDDFAHLVQDVHLPIWTGSDGMFRPIRNYLLRRVLAPAFGTVPQPYHVLLLILYAVTILSVWWCVRELAGSRQALIVTVFVALFPRNYPLLFWVAACQDLFVIPLLICALMFWLRGRDVLTLACFTVALGFKESAITCPALLALADLTLRKRIQVRRYIPMVLVTALYGISLILWGSRDVTKSDGIYGLSPLGSVLAEMRSVASLALPFHHAFGLRDLAWADWLILAIILSALAWLTVRARNRGLALFGAGWVLIALAPTCLFARAVNSDHYLFFPLVGAAILLAAVMEGHEKLAAATVLIFGAAGCAQLLQYRQEWRVEGDRAAAFEREVHNKVHFPVQRLTFVNLTHAGLSTAVHGLVIEAGVSGSVPVRSNFSDVDEIQQELLMKLRACQATNSADETFIYNRGLLLDISGQCATELIEADARRRPHAWW